MIRKRQIRLIGACVSLALVELAAAQTTPPFFGPGGGGAYDPEVAVIPSGAQLEAQGIVSADRKYVTITAGATNSRVRDLVRFPVVQTQGQGFVGGPTFPDSVASSSARPGDAALRAPSPAALDRAARAWMLSRDGMYLVAPIGK